MKTIIFSIAVCMFITQLSLASVGVEFTSNPPSGSMIPPDLIQISNGVDGKIIKFVVQGNPGQGTRVRVFADDPNERIELIEVEVLTDPASASPFTVNLNIEPKPSSDGSISYLGSV